MKDIIEPLAFIARREIPNCKGCGGSGMGKPETIMPSGESHHESFGIIQTKPIKFAPYCPNCAELRKIAEMEWHEVTHEDPDICSCGAKAGLLDSDSFDRLHLSKVNPTLTITQIAGMMKTCSVWYAFLNMLRKKITDTADIDIYGFADILTSDEFYPVVAEFLRKEVVG